LAIVPGTTTFSLPLPRSARDLLGMAEAYPVPLRTRVVNAYEAGEGSYATIAGFPSNGVRLNSRCRHLMHWPIDNQDSDATPPI